MAHMHIFQFIEAESKSTIIGSDVGAKPLSEPMLQQISVKS